MRALSRLFGALAALLVMVAGFLVWRLAQGPIPLDFLTPRIEAAARAASPDLTLQIGSTALAWDGEERQLELLANDVRISGGLAGQGATVPSVAVRARIAPLLRGEIELASVDLISPTLELERQPDGAIRLGLAGAEGTGGEVDPASFLARLGALGVRDGTVRIDDRVAGRQWQLSQFDLDVEPAGERIHLTTSGETDAAPLLGTGAGQSLPARLEVEATVEPQADRADIERARLVLPDAEIHAKGSASGARSGTPAIELEARMASFATDALARYWPPAAAPEARAWVTANISGGRARDAVVKLRAGGGSGAPGLQVQSLDARLAFEGLSVRFLDTMPPVTAVAGTASATLDGGAFSVTSGQLLDVAVSQASVRLPAKQPPSIAIEAQVAGPLTSVFAVLEREPVRLGHLLGFAPRAGAVTGHVAFAFPLRDRLRFEDLGLVAKAEVRDAAVPRLAGDWDLDGGRFALALQGASVTLEGAGRLQGVALTAKVSERIGHADALRIDARGDLDTAGWKRLGIDPLPWLDGTSDVRAHLQPLGAGGLQVEVEADVRRAVVDLPGEALHKPAGEPGNARGTLRFENRALTRIDGFQLDYGGNRFQGRATRAPAGGWRTVTADATLAPRQAGRSAAQLSATVAVDKRLVVQSPDAGALLAAFGMPVGSKGTLGLSGTIDLDQPGVPLDGKFSVLGITITDSPLLAQILTYSSLRGLGDAMRREGIPLDRVTALIAQRDGVITIRQGVARGSSLGLQASGTIDANRDSLDLQGSVIPSYFGINQGIGKVPLLGQLLAGTQGKGVQSFDFTATGTLQEPKVKVSALSSLTPNGFAELWRRLE